MEGMEEAVRLCRIWGRVVLETRLPVGKAMPLAHLPPPVKTIKRNSGRLGDR